MLKIQVFLTGLNFTIDTNYQCDSNLCMDKNQLRQVISDNELTQAEFSQLLGVTARTVTSWLSGERAVPNTVISYLRLFNILTPNLRQIELSILSERKLKMREGMYGISFQSSSSAGMGALVFENGKIYGADSSAVKFDGTYIYDAETKIVTAKLKVTYPPNVETIFGISNPYEWAIDVDAFFNPNADQGKIIVQTSIGDEVEASFKFLRAMPAEAA